MESGFGSLEPVIPATFEDPLDEIGTVRLDKPQHLVRQLPVTFGPQGLSCRREAVLAPRPPWTRPLVSVSDEAFRLQCRDLLANSAGRHANVARQLFGGGFAGLLEGREHGPAPGAYPRTTD